MLGTTVFPITYDTGAIAISQTRKLRLRDINSPVQGHTANEQQSGIQTQMTPEAFPTTSSYGPISQGVGFAEKSQCGIPGQAPTQESEVLVPSQGAATKQLCDLQVVKRMRVKEPCERDREFF